MKKRLQRYLCLATVIGAMLACADRAAGEDRPVAAQQGRTIRVLTVGNSFANNAASYLNDIVKSQGNMLVLGLANIGGCSLEKHWDLAQKSEADPASAAGKAYYLTLPSGGNKKVSLKEYLQQAPWDVVTIQQHSWTSADLKTFRPFSQQLADYIRKNCPSAKVWVHETWAYREDNRLLQKAKLTQAQMYDRLHEAYATIAKEVDAAGILPVGTAFQNARQEPLWQMKPDTAFDEKTAKYPEKPNEPMALCQGWRWDTNQKPPVLEFDGKHCTSAGKYLAGLVWYVTLFGELRQPVFAPADLSKEQAESLQAIASRMGKGRTTQTGK